MIIVIRIYLLDYRYVGVRFQNARAFRIYKYTRTSVRASSSINLTISDAVNSVRHQPQDDVKDVAPSSMVFSSCHS